MSSRLTRQSVHVYCVGLKLAYCMLRRSGASGRIRNSWSDSVSQLQLAGRCRHIN